MTDPLGHPPHPAPGTHVDPSKVPLVQIIRGLTTGQVWKLAGALSAIVLFAAAAGNRVEGWQRESAINAAIAPKNEKIEELSRKIDSLSVAFETVTAENTHNSARLVDARRLIAFADKYVTYLTSGEDPARSIFADHVCMLYRESQQADVGIDVSTTNVTQMLDNLRAPETRDALLAIGIDQAIIDELIELRTVGISRRLPSISRFIGHSVEPSVVRVGPFNANAPPVPASHPQARQYAAEVDKRLSNQKSGQLVKIVTFIVEGRQYSYTMSPEIADLVHNNRDCRLR